jgi:hypothetical protein
MRRTENFEIWKKINNIFCELYTHFAFFTDEYCFFDYLSVVVVN